MAPVKFWCRRRMNRLSFHSVTFLLLSLISSFQALAVDLDASNLLKIQLGKLDSFTASFSQRLIDIDQTKVDPSSGTIMFKRPGKFIWSYLEPYEQDIIYRTEIPDDYFTVTSGILGDQKPCSIILVPLIANEKLQGVMEFASIKEKIPRITIEFLSELGEHLLRIHFANA